MRFVPLFAVALLLVAGCEDSTAPEFTLPNGSMSARVDGTAWNANVIVHAGRSASFVVIGGGGHVDGKGITVTLTAIDQPGTHTLGTPLVAAHVTVDGREWRASQAEAGSGSITITTIDATRVAGTFTFTAPAVPGTGSTGNSSVTEGSFNILF